MSPIRLPPQRVSPAPPAFDGSPLQRFAPQYDFNMPGMGVLDPRAEQAPRQGAPGPFGALRAPGVDMPVEPSGFMGPFSVQMTPQNTMRAPAPIRLPD